MAKKKIKRKTYRYRGGQVIDVEEYPDGRYGGRGQKRGEKEKPTEEQMRKVNAMNKARRCRQKMLLYIKEGDLFVTWTYAPKNRPPDMKAALKDFEAAMRKVRAVYKKRGRPLFWFRNIQKGTKGAWHIHLVINEIGDTASILQHAWTHGGTWSVAIRHSRYYDEDFTKLANYMTRDEYSTEPKADGTPGKPRIALSGYNTSRNMPLPEPKVDELVRWEKEPKPKKGYYIASMYEGKNPVTGCPYRRYTMIRLDKGGGEDAGGRDIHKHKPAGKRKRKRQGHVPDEDPVKKRAGL